MGLKEYNRKRDFTKTKEPKGALARHKKDAPLRFVIQKHEASRLHYDFRLEMDGVLRSWAVPKGPSLNPADKRLAVQVEDHPMDYGGFEGIIPEGEYGGGTVMLWDEGEWEPLEGSAHKQWAEGNLKFRLKGQRLKGTWALIRMKGGRYGDSDKNWLLIKEKDEKVSEVSVTEKFTTSVTTSRKMEEIAAGKVSKKKTGKGGMRVWGRSGEMEGDPEKLAKKATPAAAKTPKASKPVKSSQAAKTPRARKTAKAAKSKASQDPEDTPGARKAKFPLAPKPQLATLATKAPKGGDWAHEVKFDGYRFLALVQSGEVTLLTRSGKDWTSKFREVAEAIEQLPVETAVLDGELVALDSSGVSRFQLLQNAIKDGGAATLVYYAFDLLYLNGYDLKSCELKDRKTLLEEALSESAGGGLVRYSAHFSEAGDEVWEHACKMGLEGIISKDLTAPYVEKRSKSWLKVKCANRQEFVIGGFTKPSGSRTGLGALLVGFHDEKTGELKYAGKVGTGFTDASLKELHGSLSAIAQDKSPFVNPPTGSWLRGVTWVKPSMIGEVAYTEMTSEGLLRHPSFQGLREDKPAKAVTVERPVDADQASTSRAKSRVSAKTKSAAPKTGERKKPTMDDNEVKLTNPDRVLFPDEKYTKQDLADYYAAVSDVAFPWISHRPTTLVRCPEGRDKPCFYQRHTKETAMPGIEPVDVPIKGRTETYFYISEPVALRALVQSSALELHGWQCKVDDLDRPDRIIFDVDPSPEVEWDGVIKAARKLKQLLEKCGFETFVMTTGGKGLHVVVPLKPQADWDEVGEFAEAIARFLESTDPDNYTANLSKAKRTGKVFVDYLRNKKTASAVLPYSSRARQGATVATPITWAELKPSLDPRKFNIKTVPARLARQKQHAWEGYEKARKALNLQEVLQRLTQ